MGSPIKLRDKFIGYIIVEHNIYKFMTIELKLFLRSIANQIAISIENSLLYKELEKINQRDSLLGIYNRKYFFEYLTTLWIRMHSLYLASNIINRIHKEISFTLNHEPDVGVLIRSLPTHFFFFLQRYHIHSLM
jgi:hypothetical protein